jgi:hypothetical protein
MKFLPDFLGKQIEKKYCNPILDSNCKFTYSTVNLVKIDEIKYLHLKR